MKKIKKRTFEIVPGILVWAIITSPIWGSYIIPEASAIFVITCNVYAFYKSISTVIYFIIGHLRIRNDQNQDWMSNLQQIENRNKSVNDIESKLIALEKETPSTRFKKRFSQIFNKLFFYFEKKKAISFLKTRIRKIKSTKESNILDWHKVKHIVIIPFWKEPYSVLKRSLDRLADQTLPTSQITIILGAEQRHAPAMDLALKLKKEYEGVFGNFWINNHVLTVDEVIGKAANMASAGRYALKKIEELGWDKSHITVTSCDSDTQFDRQYFAYLTYLFATDPDRYTHYYAAPMVYYANIWKVPFFGRISNTVFSINNIATSVRTDKYIQVSSYSFSWKMLEGINYWAVDVIPEDFHMFFKSLFIYGDKVSTVPIYLKNLSDAAESVGFLSSAKNQYEQVKRWAWGVSDHGWMITSWLKSPKKSLYTLYRVLHTIFDHLTWSSLAFILLFGANVPLLLNPKLQYKLVNVRLPGITSLMMSVASIFFFLILIIDYSIKPKPNKPKSLWDKFFEMIQWIALPAVTLFFGTIPGLDAQTRLLFGKYLEYRLTEKH